MGRPIDEESVISIVEYECCELKGLAERITKQIKALPSTEPNLQQTCFKTEQDDTVSRQAAIDSLTDENIIEHLDSVYDSELHRFKRATERIIAQLPSVEPEHEYTIEEFMFGQDMGNPEDGSL